MIKRYRPHRILHGAVEHNGILFFSGHAAKDLSEGMAGQTRQICQQFDTLLAECGSDKTRILQARIYITDMSLKEEMNQAWLEWLAPVHLPARATIGVADLGKDILVEIVITAAA